MASSKVAKKATTSNQLTAGHKQYDNTAKEIARIKARYKDAGSSGKAQMKKELEALSKEVKRKNSKRLDKATEDFKNISRYGKDAMKSRGFAQYNKGGMVKSNCGASMKPNGRAKKK